MFHDAEHDRKNEAGELKVHVDKFQALETRYRGRILQLSEILDVASRILLYHPYVDNNGRIAMLFALKLFQVANLL
jgi:hypothetical protein